MFKTWDNLIFKAKTFNLFFISPAGWKKQVPLSLLVVISDQYQAHFFPVVHQKLQNCLCHSWQQLSPPSPKITSVGTGDKMSTEEGRLNRSIYSEGVTILLLSDTGYQCVFFCLRSLVIRVHCCCRSYQHLLFYVHWWDWKAGRCAYSQDVLHSWA